VSRNSRIHDQEGFTPRPRRWRSIQPHRTQRPQRFRSSGRLGYSLRSGSDSFRLQLALKLLPLANRTGSPPQTCDSLIARSGDFAYKASPVQCGAISVSRFLTAPTGRFWSYLGELEITVECQLDVGLSRRFDGIASASRTAETCGAEMRATEARAADHNATPKPATNPPTSKSPAFVL
jgi:hypothetical protein